MNPPLADVMVRNTRPEVFPGILGMDASRRDFTDNRRFTNHDPHNERTLYAAEVTVHPQCQGRGVGKKIYAVRRALVERLGLLRIRAGARLRGYHRYAGKLTPEEYVISDADDDPLPTAPPVRQANQPFRAGSPAKRAASRMIASARRIVSVSSKP